MKYNETYRMTKERERKSRTKKLGLKSLAAITVFAVILETGLFLAFDYGERRRGEYSQIRDNLSGRCEPSCFVNAIVDRD